MAIPRRYKLYDILEEIHDKIPTYTVISEPEEPEKALRDAPLLERYPWAGPLDKVPQEKQDIENGPDKLENYFGSYTYDARPPWGRRHHLIDRRGWPRVHTPPWLNRPLWGEGCKTHPHMPWSKD